jgi:hypothetical protein
VHVHVICGHVQHDRINAQRFQRTPMSIVC